MNAPQIETLHTHLRRKMNTALESANGRWQELNKPGIPEIQWHQTMRDICRLTGIQQGYAEALHAIAAWESGRALD